MLVNNRQIFLRATEVPAFSLVISEENSLSQIQSNQPEPQLFSLLQKRPKIDQFSTLSSSFTWRKIKYVRSFLYFTAVAVFTVFWPTYFGNILYGFKNLTSVMITNSCKPCAAGTFNMCIVCIEKAFVMKIIIFIQNCCRWIVMLSISAMFR